MSFIQGAGGLMNFVLTSGACLSITERINLFRMSNWSSVSLNEYTIENGNVLKSFMQVSKLKFQISYEFITYFILVCRYVYGNVGTVVVTYCGAG